MSTSPDSRETGQQHTQETVLDRLVCLNATIDNCEEALRLMERHRSRIPAADFAKVAAERDAARREFDWLTAAIARATP